MSTPKRPLLTCLSAGGNMNAICDQELLTRALQYRIDQQLMKPEDFYRNITVWKFVHKDGTFAYYPRANDSDEAGLEKSVQMRIEKGMSPRKARKDAVAYPTNSGIHSEVNVVADIYRRSDIARGLTHVAQVFTERIPCVSCRTFMRNMFPRMLSAPFYYYLQPPGTERNFQTRLFGGDVMLYLLSRYGA
jgi:hypothetical protein